MSIWIVLKLCARKYFFSSTKKGEIDEDGKISDGHLSIEDYLTLYLFLGMKLIKIHRILKFKQSDSMKKYIDFNTEKRKKAANDFEKDFFKLMINSVYGKTMENLRKRINVRLVNNAKDFLKYTSRPTYVTHKLFEKGYAAIHEIKPVLEIIKPISVGFTVFSELLYWIK